MCILSVYIKTCICMSVCWRYFKFTIWVFHKTSNKLSNAEISVHKSEDFNETNVYHWIANLYFDLYLDLVLGTTSSLHIFISIFISWSMIHRKRTYQTKRKLSCYSVSISALKRILTEIFPGGEIEMQILLFHCYAFFSRLCFLTSDIEETKMNNDSKRPRLVGQEFRFR